MKLSVIVPVYNAQDYLHDCIGSLLAQTLEDSELILVNDGSADASKRIMEEYGRAHPDRISCLTVENGGQGRARNIGLELAKGEYVGFVDSDDWVLPEMYEKLCTKAEVEQADVVVCDIRKVYEDGSTELLTTWQENKPLASAGSACDKVFRRGVIGDIRFPEGLWYEDFAFSAKVLMRSKKTVYLPEELYLYRCGQPSTMHNNNAQKNLDILSIMEDLRRFLDSGEGKQEDFEYLLLSHVLLDSISRLAQQDDPQRKDVIGRLRSYVRESIPNLSACRSFRQESMSRRTVMLLNYLGMEDLAQQLLRMKRKLN